MPEGLCAIVASCAAYSIELTGCPGKDGLGVPAQQAGEGELPLAVMDVVSGDPAVAERLAQTGEA